MKCPDCGETVHLYITEDVDENTVEIVVICPEHGTLMHAFGENVTLIN